MHGLPARSASTAGALVGALVGALTLALTLAVAGAATKTAAPSSGTDPAREATPPSYRVVRIADSAPLQHSRDPDWKPDAGLPLEVTGIAALDDDRVAVTIRKGEVWILHHATSEDPAARSWSRFASGLDEPLGLLARNGDLLTVQRTELTRLRDTDGDGRADLHLTETSGWHVSGNYHGYAYGPVADHQGNLWLTLNLDIGKDSANHHPWRGWALRLRPDGTLEPVAAGLRSPCGLGVNAAGDVFATDQQGDWIPTNSLVHLRPGAFFGHPGGMATAIRPESPVDPLPKDADFDGLPFPDALRVLPQLRAPAVWFPYRKMGQSRTAVVLDDTGGRFGPFEGQFFIGEFTQSRIGRVFLEKIDGTYQGACFPFLEGFPAAVFALGFARDGSLFAGMTNRGWSSIGGGSYGLHRLVWTGRTPFEILEMRATHDGFTLTFTQPVDPATAADPATWSMTSFTYPLHRTYGGNEIQKRTLAIREARVAPHHRTVHLAIDGLREHFVHELRCPQLRSASGTPLAHPEAWYTLNRIPRAKPAQP